MNSMQFEFDAVVQHLYEQGRPAKMRSPLGDNSGACKYRLHTACETLSCAVGCRIPDSPDIEEMDALPDSRVCKVIEAFPNVLPEEIIEYAAMFGDLQEVHDNNAHSPDKFNFAVLAQDLSLVAKEYNLTFTEPERNTEPPRPSEQAQ